VEDSGVGEEEDEEEKEEEDEEEWNPARGAAPEGMAAAPETGPQEAEGERRWWRARPVVLPRV